VNKKRAIMKIAIASDHASFKYKEDIKAADTNAASKKSKNTDRTAFWSPAERQPPADDMRNTLL
jgi:hypothetical protein